MRLDSFRTMCSYFRSLSSGQGVIFMGRAVRTLVFDNRPEPNFLVLLRELKPAMQWGYSHLRHRVAHAPQNAYSIKPAHTPFLSTVARSQTHSKGFQLVAQKSSATFGKGLPIKKNIPQHPVGLFIFKATAYSTSQYLPLQDSLASNFRTH